jgi:hypothetical protein
MLAEIGRLHSLLRRWPTCADIKRMYPQAKTAFHHKRYLREFRTFDRAVHAAGGPAPVEITTAKLLEDIRRVTALELPDKPANQAPSPHHFWSAKGPMTHSVTAYQRRLGGGPDDWVRMAGCTPVRLRSNDPKRDIAERYRALHHTLGRLPNARDISRAGLDFSAVVRHYRDLVGLRVAVGLPPTDGGLKRGEDLSFYKGRNVDVANILFRLLLERKIGDYLPEQRWQPRRRFRADFVVPTEAGDLFIEVDGFNGAGRPGSDYTRRTDKLASYKRRRAELWVVSDKPYRPWYGRWVGLNDLRAALLERCCAPPSDASELRQYARLAKSVELNARHVRWLVERRLVRHDGAMPSRDELARFIAATASHDLLAIPHLAREIGCGRRSLENAIKDGTLVPDVQSHRVVRFRRSRIPEIRSLLGEHGRDVEPATLLSEAAAAARAGISSSYLRKLVREEKIVPDARVRECGLLRRRYSPTTLGALMSLVSVQAPPPGWISLGEFARRLGRGGNSIRRLIDRGVLDAVIARPPGVAMSPGRFLDPAQLAAAQQHLRRANGSSGDSVG